MPFVHNTRPHRWIAAALLGQLMAGTAIIVIRGQEREPAVEHAVRQQRLDDRLATAESRLDAIDRLNIPSRLAVLDDMKDRQQRIEYLTLGVIVTLGGNLLLGLLELRNKRQPR